MNLPAETSKDRTAVLAIAYHNMGVEQEFLRSYPAAILSYKKAVNFAEKNLGPDDGITQNLRNVFENAKVEVSQIFLLSDLTDVLSIVEQLNVQKRKRKKGSQNPPIGSRGRLLRDADPQKRKYYQVFNLFISQDMEKVDEEEGDEAMMAGGNEGQHE